MKLFLNCPICLSNNLIGYSIDCSTMKPHISRVKCKSCQVVFANPMADAKELSDFYQNYYDSGHFGLLNYKEKVELLFTEVNNYTESELVHKAKFISKYSKGGRFLDVGCGLGIGLIYAKQLNFELYGTELDQDAIDFVNKYFQASIFHGDLLNANYPDNYFDYIYINHVIEHVLDPLSYIKELNRILKPGGVLFIGTPNISSFIYRVYRCIKFLSGKVPGIVDGLEHTFLFNKSSLSKICNEYDFEVLEYKNIALGESIQNIIKSDLPIIKKISRYIQTLFPINQEMILRKCA